MNILEAIDQVNIKLAEFCFNNSRELIQFGIYVPSTATLMPTIVSYIYKEEVRASDDWKSWYSRLLAKGVFCEKN